MDFGGFNLGVMFGSLCGVCLGCGVCCDVLRVFFRGSYEVGYLEGYEIGESREVWRMRCRSVIFGCVVEDFDGWVSFVMYVLVKNVYWMFVNEYLY